MINFSYYQHTHILFILLYNISSLQDYLNGGVMLTHLNYGYYFIVYTYIFCYIELNKIMIIINNILSTNSALK